MHALNIIENGALIIKDGMIIDVGLTSEIASRHNESDYQVIDATGRCVLLPELIYADKHPVFSGDRVHEFYMKLEGAIYMDIQRAGGGIIYTMNSLANSTEQKLYNLLIPRLNRMLNLETTLLEAKSGYSLNFEHEVKMLKVLHRENKDHVIDIVSSYLHSHAVVPCKTPTLMAD
jgi:imidazolonepropionase